MKKKIVIGLLVIFILIQFYRPAANKGIDIQKNDIAEVYKIPEDVMAVVTSKCYDCHSNYTQYPWYSNIQPVGWWLASHINDGKKHLNFSEFKTYKPEKAAHKLLEFSDAINEGWMPLESYTFIHGDKVVSEADRKIINAWLESLPPGSVEAKSKD